MLRVRPSLPLQLEDVVQVVLVLGLRQGHLRVLRLGLFFEIVQEARVGLAKVDAQSVQKVVKRVAPVSSNPTFVGKSWTTVCSAIRDFRAGLRYPKSS